MLLRKKNILFKLRPINRLATYKIIKMPNIICKRFPLIQISD